MSDLVFDPVEHKYTLNGNVIPGVTSVIDPLITFSAPEYIMKSARERGTLVHKLTERWDAHEDGLATWPLRIDRMMCDAGLEGYLVAWRAFKRDFTVDILESEQKVLSHQYRYAGTLDRVVKMIYHDKIKKTIGVVKAVLDIKTGGLYKEYGLQTAAYMEAYNKMKGYGIITMPPKSDAVTHRFVVQLKDTGRYHLEEHTNKLDLPAFLGALALWNWRNS